MRLFERGSAAEEDVYRRLSFDPQCDTLIEEIAQARQEIEDAYNNFQNASDPDLIDCYIYKAMLLETSDRFLLRQAKMIS